MDLARSVLFNTATLAKFVVFTLSTPTVVTLELFCLNEKVDLLQFGTMVWPLPERVAEELPEKIRSHAFENCLASFIKHYVHWRVLYVTVSDI